MLPIEQSDIILIADPRVLSIPIIENNEPMLDLRNQTAILYGPSPEIPNNTNYTKLRKTVYEKIIQAQSLLPNGIIFCLYEGYRSTELQKMLFDNRHEEIKQKHPDWSEHDIFIETTVLVSPVINLDGSKNIPPHSTGGAFDIYLMNEKNEPLDMGIETKDWMHDKDGSISFTASKKISKEAQKNRQIMNEVLTAVGFVNYPTEYWHWSYGDRYWAYFKNQPNAVYGSYAPK